MFSDLFLLSLRRENSSTGFWMTSLYVLCMLCLVRGQAPLSTVIPQARILAGASHRAVLKRIFPTQRLYPGLLHSDGFFTIWSTREAVNTEVGSLSLLQGNFPTQESNWGLLHRRWFFISWATREARQPVSTRLFPLKSSFQLPSKPIVSFHFNQDWIKF